MGMSTAGMRTEVQVGVVCLFVVVFFKHCFRTAFAQSLKTAFQALPTFTYVRL